MPLLFKARMPQTPQDKLWRGLDFSPSLGLLIWSGMGIDTPAGVEKTIKPIRYIEDQARIIPLRYHTFSYVDHDLLDRGDGLELKSYARLLDNFGDKPDMSAPTFERGWLMPNGDFVGCPNGCHSDLLHYTLESSGETAKSEGWINIQPEEILEISNIPPTDEQRETLGILGFDHKGRRKSVPAFTPEFDRIRKLHVQLKDPVNAPRLMDEAAATAAILDVEKALRKSADKSMLSGLFATQNIMRGTREPEYERVKELVGAGNNILNREFELLEKAIGSIRRLPA